MIIKIPEKKMSSNRNDKTTDFTTEKTMGKANSISNKFMIKCLTTLLIMGFVLLPKTAFAEEVNLRMDSYPAVPIEGELVTIIVSFEGERNIGTINADLSYDEDLLEYQSGGGNVAQFGSGEGAISDSLSSASRNRRYEFTFLAKNGGEANFSVDFSELISFEQGSLLGEPSGNLEITIKEDQEAEEPEEEPEEIEESEDGEPSTKPSIDTNQDFRLFSIYQPIPGYEMSIYSIEGTTLLVYRAEHLPEGVFLVHAGRDDESPKLHFYDEQENTIQRAWEVERIIEKEIKNDGGVSSNFLSWPILLLLAIATILIITIVISEQILGKTKSVTQRGNKDEE